MNTVIINGVPSTTINGLLIQKLPVVQKPAIRINTSTIDGKDGDQITKLGYSAYDREILIGLHGNYDESEVIRYFNQSGTIVFSNEPEKVYTFDQVKEINLERLIRMRQAKITVHCQPFKYSLNEIPIVATGSSVAIRNNGNVIAKPKITITGSGNITFYKGSTQILSIALGTEGYITIDSDAMEAYKDSELNYKNRLVTGNYENLALPIGESTYSWTGTVTSVSISRYTRWV